jgi:hypothetical protein
MCGPGISLEDYHEAWLANIEPELQKIFGRYVATTALEIKADIARTLGGKHAFGRANYSISSCTSDVPFMSRLRVIGRSRRTTFGRPSAEWVM